MNSYNHFSFLKKQAIPSESLIDDVKDIRSHPAKLQWPFQKMIIPAANARVSYAGEITVVRGARTKAHEIPIREIRRQILLAIAKIVVDAEVPIALIGTQ